MSIIAIALGILLAWFLLQTLEYWLPVVLGLLGLGAIIATLGFVWILVTTI